MRNPKAILIVWLLALSVVVPRITQAAMLTYLSGDFYASLTVYDPVTGAPIQISDYGTSGASVNADLKNPDPFSPPNYSKGAASASSTLTASRFSFSLSVTGFSKAITSAGTSDFIYFRVDKTADDTVEYGKVFYQIAEVSNTPSMAVGTDCSFYIIHNSDIEVQKSLFRNYYPPAPGTSGDFVVAINDIIGVKASLRDMHGAYAPQYWDDRFYLDFIELRDFNSATVPIPSTLLLLGSGLLRLAGWRRFRKG